MPTGTGAQTASLVPDQPYVTDPAAFASMTKRNVTQLPGVAHPGASNLWERALPKDGILSKAVIKFIGTFTITPGTGSVDTTNEYPYNLLRNFQLEINGSSDLWGCSGADLFTLCHVRYPSYQSETDEFPGNVGAQTGLTAGAHDVELTWEIPVSMDDMSLVGALYLQSLATNAGVRCRVAADDDLFGINGDATVAIDGTWHVETHFWEVPYREGQVVVPDLSRLHGFTAVEIPVSSTGRNRLPLLRAPGLLERLFVSIERSDGNPLDARVSTADADKIDYLALTYGANKTPIEYDPASFLVSQNNKHYGQTVPYQRFVLDQVREHPVRDAIHMEGVTDLAVLADINTSVSLSNARARLVQEMLL